MKEIAERLSVGEGILTMVSGSGVGGSVTYGCNGGLGAVISRLVLCFLHGETELSTRRGHEGRNNERNNVTFSNMGILP